MKKLFGIVAGVAVSAASVSYTHLDVYKRQVRVQNLTQNLLFKIAPFWKFQK